MIQAERYALMAEELPQMKLYCEMGRPVSGRPEKGRLGLR